MKLALLGCDDETLALVREAIAHDEHALVAAYDTAAFRPQVESLAPSARLDEDWETLLLGTLADVVIVARGRLDPSRSTGFAADERRNDQLRKLVQAAVPLIVIHPGCEAIVGYELDMINNDSGGIILPFTPGDSPAMDFLDEMVRSPNASPLGPIEQIVLEREMSDRSRAKVLAQLARDISLVRSLIDDIRKMSATGPAVGETRDPLAAHPKILPSLENLSVHLSGEKPFPARWTVLPAEHEDQLHVTAIGQRGRAVMTIPAGLSPRGKISVTVNGEMNPTLREFSPKSYFMDWLEMMKLLIASPMENTEWLAACRDVEVASSVDRSLERGRAVEFFGEEHTEEQSFKGVMAVGGCLMLSVTFVAVVIAAAVEGLQLPLRESPFWRAWPFYVLAPIVLFLLLQLLQGVAKRPEKRKQTEQLRGNLPVT